ncbi:MAG: nucleotide exchange factor GrpE [Patescibacteria group bacterium]|nr:nucleotide exchange factor GrpE [Patescibacteria group bacterium]
MGKTDDEQKKIYEEKIKQLEEKNEELNNSWKRALADYQNLEKRIRENSDELAKYAGEQILREVLEPLDILKKAEEHLQDQGLSLAVSNFLKVLEENGVVKIEVVGKKFDPNLMECVEVVQGEKEDVVVEEIRAGYMFKDKILRPAQVKVGKKTAPVVPDLTPARAGTNP